MTNVQNTLANIITIPIAPAKNFLNLPNVGILFADELKFELLEPVVLESGEGLVLAIAFELLDIAAAGIVADAAELFAVEDPRAADVAAAGIRGPRRTLRCRGPSSSFQGARCCSSPGRRRARGSSSRP